MSIETMAVVRKSDGASCVINVADFSEALYDTPGAKPKTAKKKAPKKS
jgi:hypothetical protein